MNKILYFPYINLPKTDWTLRMLLYYENVGSIVPESFFHKPKENYDPFMLELVREELVIPIDPKQELNRPLQLYTPLFEYFESADFNLSTKRTNFLKGRNSKIATDKFNYLGLINSNKFNGEVFYRLKEMGLARKEDSEWYIVEKATADYLMKFLAVLLGSKLKMIPTTDSYRPIYSNNNKSIKRRMVLEELIPLPQEIKLKKLMQFKQKHIGLLREFKNSVEQIVLDDSIVIDTELYKERVTELQLRKEELTTKMNESQIKNILFGTVFGVIGAYQGLATAQTAGAVIGGVPGFANAIYSALKIERAENVFDQSGMKYLALVDKRLR